MSKKRTEPNYPIDTIEMEIERFILSLEENDIVRFAENPIRFLDPNFNPTETQFLVTQRLSAISAIMIRHAVEVSNRAKRTLGDKIISTLVDQIDRIRDLSKLSKKSRSQFVDTMTSLGEYASLKSRNQIAFHLSHLAGQLKIEEQLKIAEFIGDTFEQFPFGNRGNSAIAFRHIINSLYDSDPELSFEEQQTLKNVFKSIIENGNSHDVIKALRTIGKYLQMTPEFFDENLGLIHASLRDHQEERKEFHEVLAAFSGRIARGVQDFSDDLDPVSLDQRLRKVESIFSLLASDPHPEVRIALVDEIAIALDRLSSFDHDVLDVVKTLEIDSDPGVQVAFDRQVERGFLEYSGTTDFGL